MANIAIIYNYKVTFRKICFSHHLGSVSHRRIYIPLVPPKIVPIGSFFSGLCIRIILKAVRYL